MHAKRSFLKTSAFVLATTLLASAVDAKSFLWKATSEKGTFYMQGSVHLLKAGDYPLAPAIEEAYAKSNVLVLEADMKEMLTPETQQLIMEKAMLGGGQTLENSLTPEVYGMLSEKLAEAGLPIAALQSFKPWFTAMTLVLTKMQAMGFDPSHGIDQYFNEKANTDGKQVIGLETAKFQINLFDALAEGDQNAYMNRMFRELELFEVQLADIIAAWKIGDGEKLGALMNESFKEYPELYESFVLKRNKDWAAKLDKMASKDKTPMVVVGAAHLPGKGGLLELLKDKGYTLEQL
ncbi:MAG: TraB/GumN family protein [Verrucomicrobiota bacterium]|nr:TraB/GumN family protein [Verrucomicrobiota bacterium]